MWRYYKYFLGKLHQNYIGQDLNKNPYILSVLQVYYIVYILNNEILYFIKAQIENCIFLACQINLKQRFFFPETNLRVQFQRRKSKSTARGGVFSPQQMGFNLLCGI